MSRIIHNTCIEVKVPCCHSQHGHAHPLFPGGIFAPSLYASKVAASSMQTATVPRYRRELASIDAGSTIISIGFARNSSTMPTNPSGFSICGGIVAVPHDHKFGTR